MVDEVILEKVFAGFLWVSSANHHFSCAPYTRLTLLPEMCDSPEQAAHYHILSL
jgi:hypothetical protein